MASFNITCPTHPDPSRKSGWINVDEGGEQLGRWEAAVGGRRTWLSQLPSLPDVRVLTNPVKPALA